MEATPAASSSAADVADSQHWFMSRLPPFYTLQPVPATLHKQLALWSQLLLDHAFFRAATTALGECASIRVYTSSCDLFSNQAIHRALSKDAAASVLVYAAEHFPERCALLAPGGSDEEDSSLLVSTIRGGLTAQETAVYRWVLDESSCATTTTDLAKTGVVLTFDELVEEKCLGYVPPALDSILFKPQWSTEIAEKMRGAMGAVARKTAGSCSEESAVRALMQHLSCKSSVSSPHGCAASLSQSYRVLLFNLDGTDEPPYQGVKIGGT